MCIRDRFDIVIFGSGLTAKTMSLVARNLELSFKCIDNKNYNNETKEDTRSLALSVSSKKMLHTLGVKLKAKAVKKMVVIEGGLGEEKVKSMLTFDSNLTDEDIAFIAEYSTIERSIEDTLKIKKNEVTQEEVSCINKELDLSLIHI